MKSEKHILGLSSLEEEVPATLEAARVSTAISLAAIAGTRSSSTHQAPWSKMIPEPKLKVPVLLDLISLTLSFRGRHEWECQWWITPRGPPYIPFANLSSSSDACIPYLGYASRGFAAHNRHFPGPLLRYAKAFSPGN